MSVLDPAQIDDPWSTIAFVALVVAFLVLNWRSGRHAKRAGTDAKRAADAIEHEANPNSGASMKDSLNRIEASGERTEKKVDNALERIAVLEHAAEKRSGRRRLFWR